MSMIILFVLLIAYIISVNFYAFILVKSLKDNHREGETPTQGVPLTQRTDEPKKENRHLGKLLATGALGGAITVYVCMFIFKWKRTDLLLMLLMPVLGVLNIYLWILLFRSGLPFFFAR